MTLYSAILFLHIASAIGLFIGYGLECTISALLCRAATTPKISVHATYL